jgi:hypothetical protein
LPVQYIREGDKHLQDTHEDEQEKGGGGEKAKDYNSKATTLERQQALSLNKRPDLSSSDYRIVETDDLYMLVQIEFGFNLSMKERHQMNLIYLGLV